MMTEQPFEAAYAIRHKMIELMDSLSYEQLNKTPKELNNNIIWHIGHIMVSTEILCYWRSGIDESRTIHLADKYKNGTKPEGIVDAEEIAFIKTRLLESLQEIEDDYTTGKLKNITPYSTHTFGVTMNNIETVFKYCCLHDALHNGCIAIMKKLV